MKFIDPTGRELTFIGADADYIVNELSRLTGLTLVRDPVTGKVSIDKTKKRKTKNTSTWFADKVTKIIRDPRVNVKITTDRDAPGVLVDSYSESKLDVSDYNAFKRADWKFAATALAHVLAEYYHEQLMPFAGTASADEVPGGGARSKTTRDGRFLESHIEGLYFESQVLSDFTGWWEQPAERTNTKITPDTVMGARGVFNRRV